MSALSPASEVILRHVDQFEQSNVLFAGDLQDLLPGQFQAKQVKVHCSQYHHWLKLNQLLGEYAEFSLLPSAAFTADCDTLVYYWPKSKQEALFQLESLLSVLPKGCNIFIVGENRSGVRSAEGIFESFGPINKVDSARRCSLYFAQLEQPVTFDLAEWWHNYPIEDLTIKTLPGVFSRDNLDMGSKLLLAVLADANLKGDVLDIRCGAGVLSAVLKRWYPEINITLTDVNSAAIASSQATLVANGFAGQVFASDVFSEVKGRFNLIISNPPFHDGLQTNLQAAETLIRGARNHLQLGGYLCIVANAFLPYPDILDQTFGNHEVLAQNGRFKVYRARMQSASAMMSKKRR